MNTASFWQKNQVLIVAIASSLAVVLQPFVDQDVINWKAVGLACLVTIGGVIGRELRGKGFSIAGILAVAGTAMEQMASTGDISITKMILPVAIGILSLAAPPLKSIGYEKTDIIKQAIKEGESDVPTPIGPKPDKVVN